MQSIAIKTNDIQLPLIDGKFSMIPFNLNTLDELTDEFKTIAENMLKGIEHIGGTAFLTLHGKKLKKGQTLRRGGPHTDGNYEQHFMSFGSGGGNGWKVGQGGPGINTSLHKRQYCKETGGIILASNYEACLGWNGEYKGLPGVGGDCSHIELDDSFELQRNVVYYGNNHFIHESLAVDDDVHRVFARITMPEGHIFEG